MSAGPKFNRKRALAVAEEVRKYLAPTVERIELAGSLRRGRERVGDVEFVAVPKVEPTLFGDGGPDLERIRYALVGLGRWVKGGDRMMQVTDVLGRLGLKLELYLVSPPAQWGSIFAIRTGPAPLGQACVSRMIPRGLRHRSGRVVVGATGETIPTPTEEDFFRLADVPYVPPEDRDLLAKRVLSGEFPPLPLRG